MYSPYSAAVNELKAVGAKLIQFFSFRDLSFFLLFSWLISQDQDLKSNPPHPHSISSSTCWTPFYFLNRLDQICETYLIEKLLSGSFSARLSLKQPQVNFIQNLALNFKIFFKK